MRDFIHKLVGFDLARFRWYRKWQGGFWTLVYVEAIDNNIWVKDYKEVVQAKTIKRENW